MCASSGLAHALVNRYAQPSSSRSPASPGGRHGYKVSGQKAVRGSKQNSRMYCTANIEKDLPEAPNEQTFEYPYPYWGSRGNRTGVFERVGFPVLAGL